MKPHILAILSLVLVVTLFGSSQVQTTRVNRFQSLKPTPRKACSLPLQSLR